MATSVEVGMDEIGKKIIYVCQSGVDEREGQRDSPRVPMVTFLGLSVTGAASGR